MRLGFCCFDIPWILSLEIESFKNCAFMSHGIDQAGVTHGDGLQHFCLLESCRRISFAQIEKPGAALMLRRAS